MKQNRRGKSRLLDLIKFQVEHEIRGYGLRVFTARQGVNTGRLVAMRLQNYSAAAEVKAERRTRTKKKQFGDKTKIGNCILIRLAPLVHSHWVVFTWNCSGWILQNENDWRGAAAEKLIVGGQNEGKVNCTMNRSDEWLFCNNFSVQQNLIYEMVLLSFKSCLGCGCYWWTAWEEWRKEWLNEF